MGRSRGGNQTTTGKKLLVTKRNMRSGSGALSTWGTNLHMVFFQVENLRMLQRERLLTSKGVEKVHKRARYYMNPV